MMKRSRPSGALVLGAAILMDGMGLASGAEVRITSPLRCVKEDENEGDKRDFVKEGLFHPSAEDNRKPGL